MEQHTYDHLWHLASVTEERVLLSDDCVRQAFDLLDSLYGRPWYSWARDAPIPEQDAPRISPDRIDREDPVALLVPDVWAVAVVVVRAW